MEQEKTTKLLSFIGRAPMGTVAFFKNNRSALLLMLSSGVLLTIIHPPLNLSFLAWVAWVPFMLACRENIGARRLMVCAYLGGLCFWFGNLYWLVIVTFPGYITFSFVQACYWPLLALSVRWVRQKKRPLFLTAPLIFVGAEAIQGWLFTGFSWYYLAHSQYQHLPLIQICDIFGALGVSVLIAMVNGLTVDWILYRLRSMVSCVLATLTIAALLVLCCWYGFFQLAEAPDYLRKGPLVGSVQPNVPAYVKEEMASGQKLLDGLIADSDQCFEAGAALVCWPETMVLAPLNPDYLAVCVTNSDPPRYHKQIAEHANEKGFVLLGAHSADIGVRDSSYAITGQYNSAFLYRPDGEQDPTIYHKIHLVPFGEFIPFRDTAWIFNFFMLFNPYDYDYSLAAGTDYTLFDIEADGQQYAFGVLICYEDTDPTVTRKLVLDEEGQKKADWLVNISNDGWYVHFKERQVVPMVELAQRTAISVFRCIENRISIIRSVNTGISCLIDPSGRIRNTYEKGNLPKEAMARQGVSGWFVDTIPIDRRVTLFSRHGRWLDVLSGSGWSLILLLSIYNSWKTRSTRKKQT
jgi:apolipoprotein N-acyltransferase